MCQELRTKTIYYYFHEMEKWILSCEQVKDLEKEKLFWDM